MRVISFSIVFLPKSLYQRINDYSLLFFYSTDKIFTLLKIILIFHKMLLLYVKVYIMVDRVSDTGFTFIYSYMIMRRKQKWHTFHYL
jgi:hypothetical protein